MKRPSINAALSLLVIVGLLATSVSSAIAETEIDDALSAHPVVPSQAASSTTLYIPLIANSTPDTTIFGIQADHIRPGSQAESLGEASPTWVRGLTISWSAFEPTRGAQNWDSLADFEQELKVVQSKGGIPIVTISTTPSWAQKVPGYSCGPIAEPFFGDFVRFISAIVTRYGSVNYNVRYWELWNEPDVNPSDVSGNSPFGCWGDPTDSYYGGGYYGKLLQQVYPVIKRTDANAQLLIGGLLLDCDPRSTFARVNARNPGCATSRFLEGVLAGGAGASFDGISFHAYDYYGSTEGKYSNGNWNSSSAAGPVLVAKAGYIQGLLNQYGVTGKYLMNTEVALLECSPTATDCPYDQAFENTKAAYVGISYATAMATGLRANIWYSLAGQWRNSGLLDPSSGAPVAAYSAYQFANREIGSAKYRAAIGRYPGVKGYEFIKGNKKIWVLWASDASVSTDLGWVPSAVYDCLGNPVAPGSTITIGYAPVYIEWIS